MGKITTNGDGRKAHTTEGIALSKAIGKENMGWVWKIVNNQVNLESQGEALGNETTKWKISSKRNKQK